MKAPYVAIEATCVRHGRFRVERKPNKRKDCGWAKGREQLYDAVKCPKCPFWATIISQHLVTASDQPVADQTSTMQLPGMTP